MKIPSHPAKLREVRDALEQIGRAAGFNERTLGQIVLCVNEAVANIMRHAYGGALDRPITITAEFADATRRVMVRDWGRPFDPDIAMRRPYRPEEPGGVGLLCLKQCMDEVRYIPQPEGTLLLLTKRRV